MSASEALARLHADVIGLDRDEFGEQYALVVSCAYRRVEGLINDHLRALSGGHQ